MYTAPARTAPNAPSKLRALKYTADTPPEALRATIALIGRGIKDGAKYVPLRMYAARAASRARPKDYFGQVKEIYNDFVKHWRYVMDPLETEFVTTGGPQILEHVIGLGAGRGEHGAGDCDDATIALGALLRATGFPVLINTIEKPGPPGIQKGLFSHVFPSVKVPGLGWMSVDAVGHPKHPLGWTPPYSRLAVWDLDSNLVATKGQFPPAFADMLTADVRGITRRCPPNLKGVKNMSLQGIDVRNDFPDQGLDRYGLAGTDYREPLDWSTHAALGFGAYVDRPMPIVDNASLGLLMEYNDSDIVAFTSNGTPLVRTKMLEMDPREVAYALKTGAPRPGAVALSDDGQVYQWTYTPMGGFFSNLFSKVKEGVKKVTGGISRGIKTGIRWVGSKAKALIKKLPGGQYLLKVYDRVKKIGMKLVGPLTKYLGPLAKKVAPIAALIPGYGPVVAAALYKAGDMAEVLKKHKVLLDKAGRPKFKSGAQAKKVKSDLEKKAKKVKEKERKKKKKKIAAKKAQKKAKMKKLLAKKLAKREAELRRELEAKYKPTAKPVLIAPPPPEGTRGLGSYYYH